MPLDLTEMGLPAGTLAEVVSIEPGPGRVVLTTISHLHPNVWELAVQDAAGQIETIRATATHKMHSARRGWQNAADLHPGEPLTSHAGALTLKTVREFYRGVAQLGGFLGRKGDGEPGWQTIWGGLEKLLLCLRGAEVLRGKCG